MEIKDIVFEPHNDMNADDADIVRQHDNLIKKSFNDAAGLLNNKNYAKGFRAALFNSIQNKLRKLEEFLLNEFVAYKDEYYSYEEPDESQMEGKVFWMQIY